MTITTKTTRIPDVSATHEGSVVTLTFSNGSVLSLDVETLTPELKTRAAVHGVIPKLIDCAAIPRDKLTGRSATINEKYSAVLATYERLVSGGSWNMIRAGGTRSGGSSNDVYLARAIAEIKGVSVEKAMAKVITLDKEQKSAMLLNARVLEIVNRLKLANAPKDIDADELLDSMDLGD